jgi:hypothetical protein
LEKENTMSTKSKIATLAALVTFVAAPAFAGDQDSATLLQDSGRYVAQVQVPSGAYASAQRAPRAGRINSAVQAYDFQLVGHN